MSTINEYVEAATWIVETLTNPPIAGLNGPVEESPASQAGSTAAETWPRIIFQQQSYHDEMVIAGDRVWSEINLLVLAVTRGESTLALRDIAIEIDARLHKASGVTANAQIIESVRQGGFNDSVDESGISYRRLGGIYQLIVQPLNP
jgi:hypothetical protein